MIASSSKSGRAGGSGWNIVSASSMYMSSNRGIRDVPGISVIDDSISSRAVLARLCMDFSSPTSKWVTFLADNKCATAAAEFRGEIGKTVYPARMIPITVVKYVIVSALGVSNKFVRKNAICDIPETARIEIIGLQEGVLALPSSRQD
jgi:hypothetical protein